MASADTYHELNLDRALYNPKASGAGNSGSYYCSVAHLYCFYALLVCKPTSVRWLDDLHFW